MRIKSRIKKWTLPTKISVLSAMIAFIGFIFMVVTYFSGNNNSTEKSIEKSKQLNTKYLSILMPENQITITNKNSFVIKYFIKGFLSNEVPIEDLKLKIKIIPQNNYSIILDSIKIDKLKQIAIDETGKVDQSFLDQINKLPTRSSCLGIQEKIIDLPALSLANPNYENEIKGIGNIAGEYVLSLEAFSLKNNLFSKSDIKVIVEPIIFFLNKNIVDLNPYEIYSLSNYKISVLEKAKYDRVENKSDYIIDAFVDYVGVLGGTYLKIKSFQNDSSYMNSSFDALIVAGDILWNIKIIDTSRIQFTKVKWESKSNILFSWKFPLKANVVKEIYLKNYSKKIIVKAGIGASGRNAGISVSIDNKEYENSISSLVIYEKLAPIVYKFHNLENQPDENENRKKLFLVFEMNWKRGTFYVKELKIID